MSFWATQAFFCLIFALGLGATTYHPAAVERGWPSGRIYVENSVLLTVSFASAIGVLILTFVHLNWWNIGITLIGGYALMSVLLATLKQHFQWLPPSLFVLMPYAIVFTRVE